MAKGGNTRYIYKWMTEQTNSQSCELSGYKQGLWKKAQEGKKSNLWAEEQPCLACHQDPRTRDREGISTCTFSTTDKHRKENQT